ncbi:acyl-CoA dehydrogenase family protein [Microbacterium sp. A94]|uniref:acyl-CoA dehydrogenase family protein n=1 Tax=Microbacterium sp. A94 TaxID=3450717 RepID=UPI003F43DBCA
MKLTLTDEQRELRHTVRQILAPYSDSRALRSAAASPDGFDRTLWESLASAGLVGISIPEELGGSGGSTIERSIVLEELGRSMVPHPYISTAVMATDVLASSSDPEISRKFLPSIADGSLLASVAVSEGRQPWPTTGGETAATRHGSEWTLTGSKDAVIHADTADLLLVWASTDDGPAWFVVETDAPGVELSALKSIDTTRRFSRATFASVSAQLVDGAQLAPARDLATIALAAEQVGGLARILEMTVDYAKLRVQFGRPIGSFQAVKHGLADVHSSLELAVSVLRFAVWVSAHKHEELPLAAALAGAYVPGAFFAGAQAGIQFHGGIGFTLEHDAHLYYSRAKAGEMLFGGAGTRMLALTGQVLQ